MGLSFAADWLALREPADHAARAPGVTAAAVRFLDDRPAPQVVDLGCGRGSNLRFLARHLPASTRWHLVDNDAGLLAELEAAAGEVATSCLDLRTADLEAVVAGADLVTAAALIDLVGATWLERLVDAAAGAGAALLVTGSVDGRVAWRPAHPDDAAMAAAHAAHQGGDKGFGTALGTAAPAMLEKLLARRGWTVEAAAGDWRELAAPDLQAAYLDGVSRALAELAPPPPGLDAWARARRAAIDAGTSRLDVGHRDVFAAPPAQP